MREWMNDWEKFRKEYPEDREHLAMAVLFVGYKLATGISGDVDCRRKSKYSCLPGHELEEETGCD